MPLTNKQKKYIAGNRNKSPKDIANTICFLASSDADYITGQVIQVDGGMVMWSLMFQVES